MPGLWRIRIGTGVEMARGARGVEIFEGDEGGRVGLGFPGGHSRAGRRLAEGSGAYLSVGVMRRGLRGWLNAWA